MANPFDQFDAPKSNPFDQFDEPPKPVGGFGASAKQALGSLVKGAGQAAEDFLPASIGKDNAIKKYGQSVIDANPTAVQGFSDIADSPWMATKEATGNAAGSMGSMLGIRALGMGITAASPLTGPFAPATALAGQAVANVGPFVAAALPSFGGIREKQIAKDPNSTASMQDKALAAAGAGTVGLIEGKFGPQAWAMKAMTKEGRAQLAKGLAETTLAKGVGYGALKGAAVEGAEELVQNPIEQLASYEDPRTPQNVKETLFGGAMGAIGGGVLGGATGAANQMLDRTPPAAPNLAPTDQAPAVPPAIEPSSLQSAPASQSALPGQTQQVSPSSTGSLPQNTLSNQSPNQSLDQAGSPLGSPGTKEAESLAAREAEVQQIVAASGGNPGALAKVAIASIQSGASGEIQLQQANEADQAAYEQAKAEQDRQAAEQDTANQSLTKIAEKQAYAAMSEEDKRAILFSNKTVADGGKQYVGTQDGDILNGLGKPYPNRLAAARRANMEGKDWTIAPVFDGFVARRKDANGPSTEIQSGDTGSTGVRSTDSPASVGVGATDGNGVGAQSGRSPAAVLDQAGQLPKRTDAAPVATTRAQPTTLGKQTTATAGPGFTAKDVTRVPNPAPRADTTPAAQAVEAPAVVESNAAASEGLPAAGPASVEGGGVDQGTPEQAIEAKADELMGLIEAMGGNTSITKASTIALIKEKGMDAADKSIAGFKKHIADTKKRISYRDKSQPQEQPNAQAAEAIESTPKPEAGTDSSIPKPAASDGVAAETEAPAARPSYAINDAIRTLRAKAHNNAPKTGPRGDVRMSSHHKGANFGEWVSFEDAVAEARKAVASGVRPVPFQIHNALDVNIGDTDRIIAALSAPAAKPVTPQVAPSAPEAGKPAEPVAQDDPHFEAAKALLDAQKKSTGNVIAEARVRKQVRDLAEKVPEGSKAALVLDTAATRLGMGEGKLKGLEFAPAVTATPVEQPAQASTSRPGEPTAEQIESVGDVVRITKSAGKEIKRTVNARDAMKTLNERAEALQTLAEACKK